MDLPSLTKLVLAIRKQAPTQRLIVFGSGSLLGSFAQLGVEDSLVKKSRDADFVMLPWDEQLAHAIHAEVGADFQFDRDHGFYADLVRPMALDNFPPGWEDPFHLKAWKTSFAWNPTIWQWQNYLPGGPRIFPC